MPQMAPSLWIFTTTFVFFLFLSYSCLNYYSCLSDNLDKGKYFPCTSVEVLAKNLSSELHSLLVK
uniref:ATP synthase subunit 8 n=1 Tax=Hoplopleura kitti TaxID=1511644 RepID=A0A075ECM6_9NEOP|nr:ATP synthase subunit 8 [Hoplopleura kitti]